MASAIQCFGRKDTGANSWDRKTKGVPAPHCWRSRRNLAGSSALSIWAQKSAHIWSMPPRECMTSTGKAPMSKHALRPNPTSSRRSWVAPTMIRSAIRSTQSASADESTAFSPTRFLAHGFKPGRRFFFQSEVRIPGCEPADSPRPGRRIFGPCFRRPSLVGHGHTS